MGTATSGLVGRRLVAVLTAFVVAVAVLSMIPLSVQAQQEESGDYAVIAWLTPADVDEFVNAGGSSTNVPGSIDIWGSGQTLAAVKYVNSTTGALNVHDNFIATQCGVFQVDVYYNNDSLQAGSEQKVANLIAGGKLFGPGNPPEPLIPGGWGSAYKMAWNNDCDEVECVIEVATNLFERKLYQEQERTRELIPGSEKVTEDQYRWYRQWSDKHVQGWKYVGSSWVADPGNWNPVPAHLNPANILDVGPSGTFNYGTNGLPQNNNGAYGLPNNRGPIPWEYQGGEQWFPSETGYASLQDFLDDPSTAGFNWQDPVANPANPVTIQEAVPDSYTDWSAWANVGLPFGTNTPPTLTTPTPAEADGVLKQNQFLNGDYEQSDWLPAGETPEGEGWKLKDTNIELIPDPECEEEVECVIEITEYRYEKLVKKNGVFVRADESLQLHGPDEWVDGPVDITNRPGGPWTLNETKVIAGKVYKYVEHTRTSEIPDPECEEEVECVIEITEYRYEKLVKKNGVFVRADESLQLHGPDEWVDGPVDITNRPGGPWTLNETKVIAGKVYKYVEHTRTSEIPDPECEEVEVEARFICRDGSVIQILFGDKDFEIAFPNAEAARADDPTCDTQEVDPDRYICDETTGTVVQVPPGTEGSFETEEEASVDCTEVEDEEEEVDEEDEIVTTTTAAPTSELPVTGTRADAMVWLAVALLGMGLVLVTMTRRIRED